MEATLTLHIQNTHTHEAPQRSPQRKIMNRRPRHIGRRWTTHSRTHKASQNIRRQHDAPLLHKNTDKEKTKSERCDMEEHTREPNHHAAPAHEQIGSVGGSSARAPTVDPPCRDKNLPPPL